MQGALRCCGTVRGYEMRSRILSQAGEGDQDKGLSIGSFAQAFRDRIAAETTCVRRTGSPVNKTGSSGSESVSVCPAASIVGACEFDSADNDRRQVIRRADRRQSAPGGRPAVRGLDVPCGGIIRWISKPTRRSRPSPAARSRRRSEGSLQTPRPVSHNTRPSSCSGVSPNS